MKGTAGKCMLLCAVLLLFPAIPSGAGQTAGQDSLNGGRTGNGHSIAYGSDLSFARIAAGAVTHVVNISAVRIVRRSPLYDDPSLRRYFGPDYEPPDVPERIENSVGSGVIISAEGDVVTNNHVVDGAGRIRVTCAGEREFDAEIVGADPGTDLAVIRIKEDCTGLTPITFANSDDVRVGDIVFAIGDPFGLNRSVSIGIVSGLGRANFGVVDYENFIQTDAAINPGNSGGPLVNIRGELIGINTAILSGSGGSQGVGFAIPSNMIRDITRQLMTSGRVVRGFLGVSVQMIDQDMMDAFRLSGDKGVLVTDVEEDSPAARAGLRREDVILRIDGETIDARNEFRNRIAFSPPGKPVRVSVIREGGEISLDATLGELESSAKPAKITGWKPRPGGLAVTELTMQSRQYFQVPRSVKGSVVVAQVEPGSAAEIAGFFPGDVILDLNRVPVASIGDFTRMYHDASGNILFRVQRGSGVFYRYLRNE